MVQHLAAILFLLVPCSLVNVTADTSDKSANGLVFCTSKVVDSDGRAIGGAIIELYKLVRGGSRDYRYEPAGQTESKSDGSFSFSYKNSDTDERTGQHLIMVVRKKGYALGFSNWMLKENFNSDIALTPGKKLSGTVKNSKGGIIAGAIIEITPYADDWAGYYFAREIQRYRDYNNLEQGDFFATRSDEAGHFEFDHIPADARILIRIRATGFPETHIDFKPDEQTDISEGWDINAVLLKNGTVTGKVIDEKTNKPISDILVSVVNGKTFRSGRTAGKAVSDSEGKFTIECIPGRYNIEAQSQDSERKWFFESMEVEVKEATETTVGIKVNQGELVTLEAIDLITKMPIEGAAITVKPAGNDNYFLQNRGTTNSDGIAVVRMMPGAYNIYFQSNDYNNIPTPNAIVVEKGEEQQVTLLARNRRYRFIENTIEDHLGEPVAGAAVIVYNATPINERENQYECEIITHTVSDSHGAFSLAIHDSYIERRDSGLTTIVYKANGHAIGWGNLNRNGYRTNKKIVLGEPKSYVTTITDSSGEPIRNAKISVLLRDRTYKYPLGFTPEVTGNTDEDGILIFADFPITAIFDSYISAEGYLKKAIDSHNIKWTKDDVQNIDFTLNKTSLVKGRLIHDNITELLEGLDLSIKIGHNRSKIEPDGTFSIECLPGKHKVRIYFPPGKLDRFVCNAVEVAVDEGQTHEVELNILEGCPVELRVINYLDNSPVPDVTIDMWPLKPGYNETGKTDQDGKIKYRLAPGEYKYVLQQSPEYKIVPKNFMPDNRTTSVDDTRETQEFQVYLIPDSAEIGTVKSSEELLLEGVEIYSMVTGNLLATTNGKGEFAFDDKETGHNNGLRRLLAWHREKDLVSYSNDHGYKMKDFSSAITISGRFIGNSEAPLTNFTAEIGFDRYTKPMHHRIKIENDGRFTINKLPQSKKYEMTFKPDGYGQIERTVEYHFGHERHIDIGDLSIQPRNLSLRGVVLDTNGEGVEGEKIYIGGENQPLKGPKHTGKNGEFYFEGFAPGRVWIEIVTGGSVPCEAGEQDIFFIDSLKTRKLRRSDYLDFKKKGAISSSPYPPYEIMDDSYSYPEPPLKHGWGKLFLAFLMLKPEKCFLIV